jgi:hypothetical protein
MRVAAERSIDAPHEQIRQILHDGSRYPEFMAGVTNWQPPDEKVHGRSHRYSVNLRMGTASADHSAEIVVRHPPGLTWCALTGMKLHCR